MQDIFREQDLQTPITGFEILPIFEVSSLATRLQLHIHSADMTVVSIFFSNLCKKAEGW